MGRAIPVLAFAIVALALALVSCSTPLAEETPCLDGGEQWSEYRLFFGRNIGNTEGVSDEDWSAFLADTVTPRFPDGLSVFDGAGQWRGADGAMVRERSKMVLILAPPDTGAIRRINEISEEYKRRFSQESVLRAVTVSCISLGIISYFTQPVESEKPRSS